MLTTDFATYAASGRRTRPFALPLTLAGQGCAHSTGKACDRCTRVAMTYGLVMQWARGISFEDWPESPMETRSCA